MRDLAACCALAVLMMPSPSAAQEAPAPHTPTLSPQIAQEYARPHQLIDVGDGRKMNLFCMGAPGRTVVFDSGLSDWSVIWALVQPGIAKRARACSYDRAGMGFSDVARTAQARSPVEIVSDLHTLIHAANIRFPVILVGHSLGGFNMKLYAGLYPEDVAGVVLVDPSEDRSYARAADAVTAKYGAAVSAQLGMGSIMQNPGAVAHFDACAAAAKKRDLDPASDQYKQCTDPIRAPFGPEIAAHRQKLQISAAYQETQASELANSVYGDDKFDPIYASLFAGNLFGDKPVIVLTHGIHDSTNVLGAADYFAWNLTHAQTAALSSRGVNRIVPGTHHNIEVDQPQSIIDAINEVLDEFKADAGNKPIHP
jgi:pimeloyl-ACP methyl ester carboxylesterase